MTNIEQQILDTWQIHHRITQFLLDHLPEAGFTATLSTRGGRDVARQWAHIHQLRVQWMEPFLKKQGIILDTIGKDESPDKARLTTALQQSGEQVATLVTHALAHGGVMPGFKRGIVPFIGYLISHEAHHRGNILLTLKQCGYKLPDEVKWGIWEWK